MTTSIVKFVVRKPVKVEGNIDANAMLRTRKATL